ncbi:MAG: SsrA-binding protein [Bacteroidia bacterium]|jgi:SsrA-binding protein|nr:MAG: SsrA-binding protein [Bacteroidia bacterium]
MGKEKEQIHKSVNILNRQASFNYHFLETFVAGIMLTGTEIKSVRQGKVQLQNAYCYIEDGEVWVIQMHISPYSEGTHYNHEPLRKRKLLLKKKEIRKLEKGLEEKGLTIVPVRLFINDRGWAKLEIALAKGKKLYDKRETIKERDVKREMAREEG